MGGAQSTAATPAAAADAANAANAAPKGPTYWNRIKGAGGAIAGGLKSVGSGIAGGVAAANKALTTKETTLKALDLKAVADSGIPIIVLGIAVLAYIIAAVTCSFYFETPKNIGRIAKLSLAAWLPYGMNEGKRHPMQATMTNLTAKGVTQDTMYLTNFYIQTANIAGILFDGSGRPVASLDSIRFALLGGARAFVFDLWPDTAVGDAHHGPLVVTIEPGSSQRRTSYNSIPFATALAQLIYIAFQANYQSTKDDLIILYLRFRTQRKTPRNDTMELTAKALQATIQPYRLDAAFNRCRAQATIPMLPLSAFSKKVIVVSNTNGVGTSLADYINVAPQSGIPVDYPANYASTIQPPGTETTATATTTTAATATTAATTTTTTTTTNLTEMAQKAITRIQQNLSFTAPLSEDPAAASNAWDVAGAQKLGVHCCAMNMDPGKIPSPVKDMFKEDSFVYKGDTDNKNLVFAPTTLPKPLTTPDLGLGQGINAGGVTTPVIGFG